MFNVLFNFCLFIFICYAVSGAARAILFGGSRRRKRRVSSARRVSQATATKRKARIIRLEGTTNTAARRKLRAA